MGDFNEILHYGEKVGGVLRPERQMNNFRAAINRCNLRDLGGTLGRIILGIGEWGHEVGSENVWIGLWNLWIG